MTTIAGYEVKVFISDFFSLDGGAMFGVVPKTLWGKEVASDELNRIELCCRLLVLEGHGRRILVDLGCGRKWSEKEYQIYGFRHTGHGLLHEQIPRVTDVILTHLHFDHAGGAAYLSSAGELKLSYPDAAHHLQQEQLTHAFRPSLREQASYRAENITILEQARLCLYRGSAEVLPGIRVFDVHGHTHAQQWVLVGDGEGALAFPSDLMPSAHHIHVPYIPAYDLAVEQTVEEKRQFLEQAHANKWLVVFYHDVRTAAARIGKDRFGRYSAADKVDLPVYGS